MKYIGDFFRRLLVVIGYVLFLIYSCTLILPLLMFLFTGNNGMGDIFDYLADNSY